MLSDHEKRMVKTNEPYTYDNYATFALLASGVQQKVTKIQTTHRQYYPGPLL